IVAAGGAHTGQPGGRLWPSLWLPPLARARAAYDESAWPAAGNGPGLADARGIAGAGYCHAYLVATWRCDCGRTAVLCQFPAIPAPGGPAGTGRAAQWRRLVPGHAGKPGPSAYDQGLVREHGPA